MTSRLVPPQRVGAILGGYLESRRTAYRGVLMRSRLEAAFARYLDDRQIRWIYEPALFGPPGRGYLPDFRLVRDDGWHFAEVKPTVAQAEAAKTRIEIIWETYPDAVLVVVSAQQSRWFAAVAGGEWVSWVERWRHQ